jgi:hypothetical protein
VDFEKIVWHRETAVTITLIDETVTPLNAYWSAWRRKTKDEDLMAICAALMALEILAADFMGWGTKYPRARTQAEKLLAHHQLEDRTSLMRIFKITDMQDAFDPRAYTKTSPYE